MHAFSFTANKHVHSQLSSTRTPIESVVSSAAIAAAAVSKAVSMKTLSAPDLDKTFIALDSSASTSGVVDSDGLPLVYNKVRC